MPTTQISIHLRANALIDCLAFEATEPSAQSHGQRSTLLR